MSFEVYDYREHIQNLLITPQIRARFIRIEVGEISGGPRPGQGHSHDLGHEIFLVLQGQAEFEIEGESRVLGPGQLCWALVDQIHTVRNVGAEPVILYLSVTPHIQPTHTFWTEAGAKQPPRFNPSTSYDIPSDRETPTDQLVDGQRQAATALLAAVEAATAVQQEQLAVFETGLAAGDKAAALKARDAIWEALYPMFQKVSDLAGAWNNLTYRIADPNF